MLNMIFLICYFIGLPNTVLADPGMVWVTGVGNRQVNKGLMGESKLGSGRRLTTSTPFNFASLTKPFTAFLIWRLSQEKGFSLRDPIRSLLPELPKVYDRIRVSNLIHHTSGITDYTFLCNGSAESPANAIRFLFTQKKLSFNPGSKFEYSNSNYLILSLLAERITGISFSNALRKWVLSPAKMLDAYLRPEIPFREDSRVAWAYSLGESNKLELNTSDPCDALTGDGGMVGSISDLASWAKYLNSNLSSSRRNFNELFQSGTHGLPGAEAFEYGLGWQVLKNSKGLIYQHAGGWLGYRSIFRFRPKTRTWLAILMNRDDWDIYAAADKLENSSAFR